jgi:hypothetical protein
MMLTGALEPEDATRLKEQPSTRATNTLRMAIAQIGLFVGATGLIVLFAAISVF